MAQNIYDDPEFQKNYAKLPRSVEGLSGAPEWPALRAMLPDLAGSKVLDLGCGFGWFCRFAREAGAESVLGLDVSERMLARARAETSDQRIIYERADLHQLELEASLFDLAYSSLALHYVRDLPRLLNEVHRGLRPRGSFVFSIEHPIYMAPTRPGWASDAEGRRTWPVDSYAVEGMRRTHWLGGRVIKYHRTLGTTLNALIGCGFTILHVEEWSPSPAQITEHPELSEERDRPMFALISARRQ